MEIARWDGFWVAYPGLLFKSDTFYLQCMCQPEAEPIPTAFRGRFENVIAMTVTWQNNWCHWQQDILPYLFWIPADIINSSYFVSFPLEPWAFETLEIFGLQKRLVILQKDEYIWADHIFNWRPFPWMSQNPPVLIKYRQWFVNKFSLDEHPPTRYVFLNREKTRRIRNFNEVLDVVATRYPMQKWELIQPVNSIFEAARTWNLIKLYFTPHGAASANIIYMQANTVYCEIQSDICAWYFLNVSVIFGQFCIVCRIPEMSQWENNGPGGLGWMLPLGKALAVIERALRCLKEI
jgi:hypothetical protein